MTENKVNAKRQFSAVMSTCSILCAILVVWIHTYNVEVYSDANRVIYWFQDAISQGIARGAVPFFLMSSAFFLYSKDKTIGDVYRSRAKSILTPYLLWNAVYLVVFAVLRRLALTNTGMDTVTVGNVAQGLFLHKYNYAYWFMRDLIVLVALYPLIKWILGRGKTVTVIGFIGLLVAYYCGLEFLSSAVYYYIGAVVGYHYSEAVENYVAAGKKRQAISTIVCFCIAVLLFGLKNICKIDQAELFRDLAMAIWLFLMVSVCNIRIGGVFAGLSFMIYSLHPLFLEVIEKVIYLYFPHNDLWMMIDYVVAPVICVALIVGVCFVWKRVLPKIYCLFNGGRI